MTKGKNPGINYCSMPMVKEREFGPNVNPNRERLIRIFSKKWVNETALRFYFFDKESDGEYVTLSDGSQEWRTWTTSEEEKNVVRKAFQVWKDIGIGLVFKEEKNREDADIRIGFMRGDGAWSYIGRDILDQDLGKNQRTMNFGWDLRRESEIDTAIHEIGHTLGFPHEHQNPNAGIVWDEDAVYESLAGYPNYWSPEKTYHNIIRKITPDTVQGSNWDPNSIMHYPFEVGLIKQPEQYSNGLFPEEGLSERDKQWVKKFYPTVNGDTYETLDLLKSQHLELAAGEQRNYFIKPSETRHYNISTFGESDTVIVLFEQTDNDLVMIAGDDDSGEDFNAKLSVKLIKGKTYTLRVRLYYSRRAGETAIMYW